MLMSSISAQDLQRLAGLQGYDLTLEIDALSRKHGISPEEIVALLRAANQPQQVTHNNRSNLWQAKRYRPSESTATNLNGWIAFPVRSNRWSEGQACAS